MDQKRLLVSLLVVLAATLTGMIMTAPTSSSEWVTYLADHSRTSASNATIGSFITPRWTHVVDGMVASEPVIANNRVYLTAWDGNIYALDAFDGHEIWRRYLGVYRFSGNSSCGTEASQIAGTTASPTLDLGSGLLYVAALSTTVPITASSFYSNAGIYLYAISSSTGNIVWQAPLSNNLDNYPWSSPLIANGHAYVGNASSGDCPLTQGELVSVNLSGAHDVTRVAMSPDAMTVYPMNLVTSNRLITTTPPLLPDKSDWDFTATVTLQFIAPMSATTFIQLHHADTSTMYQPQLYVGPDDTPCNGDSLVFVQNLDDPKLPDVNGNIVFSRTIDIDTTTLNDLRHALIVPGLVPCARIEPGIGGGIWSSPMYDPVTNRVFVTTGTPTPPCVQRFVGLDCTGARALIGKRTPAVVAVNANTLSVDWSWQVPFAEQDVDADFGATPTLCTGDNGKRIVGVANKNGIFYAFDADALSNPVWQKHIAIGGGGPEGAQGSISSAACVNGVFYVGAGMPPTGAVVCNGSSGQVWALSAATGNPRWINPHCTSLVLGPITAANGLLIYGTDCRLVACERRIEALDMATGNVRYRGTINQLAGLGDVVSGAAVVDGLIVIGDALPNTSYTYTQTGYYFPVTSTVRALNAGFGLYLPEIQR